MLTLYLRPKAVLGAAAIALSTAINLPHALALASDPAARERRRQQQQQEDPSAQMWRSLLMIATWLIVAYTRCVPVLMLGMMLAAGCIVCHASARQAPSEVRYRGREPLGYSLGQVLGMQPVQGGADPRLVLKQLVHGARTSSMHLAARALRWGKYYTLTLWDRVREPFVPGMRPSHRMGSSWR